ncbi:hypothetical protein WMF26_06680 [Sorangium sp. So ce185]|uniref:hypothetical protein n=1 Tax=Sorangium sp. So ce185 TaxID=3133287 RepID=UPI003F5DEF9A
MPGPVDFAYLCAACEAFPLASEASHRQAVLALRKTPSLVLDGPTQRLADELEAWIRLRARGHSLDSLRQVRDLAWFGKEARPVSMADYLVRLAERHLTHRGGHVALRTEPTIDVPLAHFRWLSLLLPADLLVAARSVDMPTDPASDHVDTSTPHVARLLQEGVADTHLHVGAAVSFHFVWIGLMTALSRHPLDRKKLARGGEPPFGTVDQFLRMLQAASVTRLLLVSFLWRRDRLGHPSSFRDFVDDPDGPLATQIAPRAAWPAGPHDFKRACVQALRATIHAAPSPSAAVMASVHRHLLGPSKWSSAKTVEELLAADPAAAWLRSGGAAASPETRFARRGLMYLLDAGRGDDGFETAFWQYQRIRALTFRHLTVEPGTAGLGWFQQHYDRISPMRACIDHARFDAAVHCSGRGIRLSAVEMRTAPEPAWASVRDLVREAAVPRVTGDGRPEVGLVLHFLKQGSRSRAGKKMLNADPRQLGHGCRFGAFSFARMEEASAIEAALAHHPELLLVLRGIDVASDELSVPTWVFVPPFMRVRRASHRAAARLSRARPRWNVTHLRATYHAGEDFRRLVEGVRRIHELLQFGLLEASDRIGHGLAAGVDPELWARYHSVTVQPAEERLHDLLWEIDRYKAGELPADAARIEQVRAEAHRLAQKIFNTLVDLDQLGAARQRLHVSSVLQRLGYPFVHGRIPEDPVDRLVHRYLTDAGVFARGQEPLEVRASEGEVRMLARAGAWLRSEIARREMTIEANPTSNLLINDMGVIDTHPAFRFQPLPGRRGREGEAIQLSINTDDPISFATSLGDEYVYLYGALLREGAGAQDALRWLAERRDDGLRSRFTLAASRDPSIVRELL